jgi:hydrogenase nickel incorporation protein HypA/HybF
MHELSIALELVDLASAEAERLGEITVVALHVRIGPLSGVLSDALRFSFDVAAAGTVIEGARLEIDRTEGTGDELTLTALEVADRASTDR